MVSEASNFYEMGNEKWGYANVNIKWKRKREKRKKNILM